MVCARGDDVRMWLHEGKRVMSRGMDEIREGSRYEVESGNDKATDIIQLIFYSKITEGK